MKINSILDKTSTITVKEIGESGYHAEIVIRTFSLQSTSSCRGDWKRLV